MVEVRRYWRLHLALGLVLIGLGSAGLANAFMASAGSALIFGWLLVASGLAQWMLASRVQKWNGFSLHVLGGILEVVIGLFVIGAPAGASLLITLLVAVYLLVGGLFRIVTGLSIGHAGAGWIALGGLVSFLLGLSIWRQWPGSGLWFIGATVGINLILHGAVWMILALEVRRPRRHTGVRSHR
jgi:uncharacterized membrane protein HdeD (DUF308 family)